MREQDTDVSSTSAFQCSFRRFGRDVTKELRRNIKVSFAQRGRLQNTFRDTVPQNLNHVLNMDVTPQKAGKQRLGRSTRGSLCPAALRLLRLCRLLSF